MAVLGFLLKLKRGLGLALVTFSAWFFFHKNVPYLILYQLTKFQRHNFLFLKISNKMCYQVLIYITDDVKNVKIYLRSSSKAMTDKEKDEKTEIQNFEYLEIKDSFLDEIKSIFHNYLRTITWWKNEN